MSQAYSLGQTTSNIVVENETADEVTLCFNFSPTAACLPVGTSWICICNTKPDRFMREDVPLIWITDQNKILSRVFENQPNEARFAVVNGPSWFRQPASREENPQLEIMPKITIKFKYFSSQGISIITDACCCNKPRFYFPVRRQTSAAAPKPQPSPSKPDQHGGSSTPMAPLHWVSPGS